MKNSIPNKPKINLSNYLSKLDQSLRIRVDSKTINKYMNNSLLIIVSKKLKYKKRTIINYFKNNSFPIFFVSELNNHIDVNLFNIIESSKFKLYSKWKNIVVPNYISPKISYLVGYLQGDGCIESNKKRICFIEEYLEQLNSINRMFEEIFYTKGIIINRKSKLSKKKVFQLNIGSKVLNSYFHEVFEINRGIKHNMLIPKLLKLDKKILRYYLSGIYDADGTLPINPERCKQFFIDITLKDKQIIDEIKNCLDMFGIKTLKPYCRMAKSPSSDFISKTWELRIRKKSEIINFLTRIGFVHPHKFKRQKKLLNIMRS